MLRKIDVESGSSERGGKNECQLTEQHKIAPEARPSQSSTSQPAGWRPGCFHVRMPQAPLKVRKFSAVSALGQKQTCAMQQAMSALPPIADMYGASGHVC